MSKSALLIGSVSLFVLAGPVATQLPGVVDYSPVPPPNSTWPEFLDVAAGIGNPGTNFADPGAGRGMAWVDVVGRDPLDPGNLNKIGPPDGILDFVQVNSDSPAFPLGAVYPNWDIPPVGPTSSPTAVFRGEPDGLYTYVTHLMGVTVDGFDIAYPGPSPWGVLPADYDGDGDADLFFPCGGFNMSAKNTLLRNDGGTFVNVSEEAGLVEDQVSFGATWLDFDRDGDLDLYVANSVGFAGPYFQGTLGSDDPSDRLYRNNGDGTFTDVAPAAGVNLKSTGFSVASSDLDNDGWADLVVSCYGQYNKLFYNNGDGTFSFVVPQGHSIGHLDIDALMTPDPAHPGAYEYAHVPEGSIVLRFPISGQGSMPVEIADMNGDGWADVLFGVYSSQLADANSLGAEGAFYSPAERSYLYLNAGDQDGDGRGDGDFREVGLEVGFAYVAGTMGMHVADFDSDGYPDVYSANGGPQLEHQLEEDLYFANDGPSWPLDFQARPGQRLEQALYEIGALTGSYGNTRMGHGLISKRSGPDGRIELVVANGGPARLNGGQENVFFANTGRADGTAYQTITFDLNDDLSAPGGYGSRVEVLRADSEGGVRLGVLDRRSGFGFGCSTTGPLVFGLGDSIPLYARTSWASGVRQGSYLLRASDNQVDLDEPRLSLDVRLQGSEFVVSLQNHDTAPVEGDLILQFVRHQSTLPPNSGYSGGDSRNGWIEIPRGVVEAGVSVESSASWSTTVPVSGPELPGLYRFLLVDRVTREPLAENAAWYEQATPFAQSRSPFFDPGVRWTSKMRPSRETPSAAKPVVFFRDSVQLSAGTVEMTSYASGDPVRVRPSRRMDFQGGQLRYADGRVDVSLPKGTLATASFHGGDVVLTLGAPAVCCDEITDRQVTLLRFSDVTEEVVVDEVHYTPLGGRTSTLR